MAPESFRFLHAASLLLDHQLQGAGPVPDSLQPVLRDATLTAFDRIVEMAVDRKVDFVLLTGDSFAVADHSLAAQSALLSGLELLAGEDIPVFACTGTLDPESAWRTDIQWPENFTRLGPNDLDPLDIEINGRQIALHPLLADLAVAPRAEMDSWSAGIQRTSGLFNIGLLIPHATEQTQAAHGAALDAALRGWMQAAGRVPVDYWGLGMGRRRYTGSTGSGIVHYPGAPQGMSARDTGPHGCTLVEVDGAGRPTLTLVPVNTIRWEEAAVSIDADMDRARLLASMQHAAESIDHAEHEQLCLLRWKFKGAGPLHASLHDPDFCQELCDELHGGLQAAGYAVWTAGIRFDHPTDSPTEPTRFQSEYLEALSHLGPGRDSLALALAGSEARGTDWEGPLKTLLTQLDPEEVLAAARRWGWSQFSETV
jgi:DNA repair exonuclease SbcCD nuclease subunit